VLLIAELPAHFVSSHLVKRVSFQCLSDVAGAVSSFRYENLNHSSFPRMMQLVSRRVGGLVRVSP